MRLSKYMILYELVPHGKWLLIHGARGIFDVVGDSAGTALSRIEEGVQTLDELDYQTRGFLADRGYIVSDDLDEDAYVAELCRRIHSQEQKRIMVALIPSYRCNFNCAYCFERGLRGKKDQDFFKTIMPLSIVDEVFRYIDSCGGQRKNVNEVTLFGGEPLLPENKTVVEWICRQCIRRGLPLSCVTNGYFLDEYVHTLQAFKKGCVKITLDGTQAVHDLRRSPASGGSFDRICRNIDAALAAGIQVGVRTNVNRANLDQIDPLTAFYRERGWIGKENFNYYFKATIPCLEPEENRVSDVEVINYLDKQICEDCHNSTYNILYRQLRGMLCQGQAAFFKAGFCGAHSGNITVDPFGDVFSCWDTMDREDCVVGHVDFAGGGIAFHPNFAKWIEHTVDQIPMCKDCKYKLFCGGGCTAQSLMAYNDTEHAMCNEFQKEFHAVATEIVKEKFCIRK